MKDRVFIIAEAGVNHNGELDLALKMCDVAKEANVDAIKFQTFNTEINVMKDCEMAEYQKKNVGEKKSHWKMLRSLELSHEEFRQLKEYCNKIDIEFISSPSEVESLNFLMFLGMDKIKISSGEITNVPFLRAIGRFNKKVILSTGMANLSEIEYAINVLTGAGTKKNNITVLHCNSEYPTPFEDVNINAMLTIKDAFKVNVGYSDHSTGIEVSIAAAALGAKVIEKHFTLDKNMNGPDHKASLEPYELSAMVKAIRNIEIALGNGIKKPTVSENKNIKICRKAIIASRDIKKGEILSCENLTVKRPEIGISSRLWDSIIGQEAKFNFMKDEIIRT